MLAGWTTTISIRDLLDLPLKCLYRLTIIQFNSILYSILYFNVLTQQLQEPITESAQEDKYIHSKEINIKIRTKLN
jgi:hypothetical protein